MFTLDRNGKITYWNEQSEKLFGLSSKEVLGKFFGNTLDLFDKRFFESIKKDLEKEKIWKVIKEGIVVVKDGVARAAPCTKLEPNQPGFLG